MIFRVQQNDDRAGPFSSVEKWSARLAFRADRGWCRSARVSGVERPGEFEHFRWVGDKRTQIVYDVDETTDEATMAKITEVAESGFGLGFGPDTLAEARNRGYRPHG